jgi:hypothetical protein
MKAPFQECFINRVAEIAGPLKAATIVSGPAAATAATSETPETVY